MHNPIKENWLPVTAKEMQNLGWTNADIIFITGDAYIDHPSFGTAIITRLLEKHNYKVAVNPQPNWQDDLRDFKKFGKPNHFFAISSGSMDSMVNHYTALKRKRSDDAYTPGDKAGYRPDYAVNKYSNIVKSIYPDSLIVIGGVEASLRRLTHYDYWQDQLFPSILISSKADVLVYGMGEKTIIQLSDLIKQGFNRDKLLLIPQIAFIQNALPSENIDFIMLPSHEDCLMNKTVFAKCFKQIEENACGLKQKMLVQGYEDKYIIVTPPAALPTEEELDKIYDLPFNRKPHPKYYKKETIPAFDMIKNSITSHRGCFGGCSFCAITSHQGKFIVNRSISSIEKEIIKHSVSSDFAGTITDIGGPTANMYGMKGENLSICEKCKRPSCIFPSICSNLNTSHRKVLDLLATLSKIKSLKHLYIGSGIRYDMLLPSYNKKAGKEEQEYTRQLILKHTSGRLKVAPEHTEDAVLVEMRKPSFNYFIEFKKLYDKILMESGKKYQLIPYFISSHPGCTLTDMIELALKTADMGYQLEQVQDFTPTPMTLASVIYYSGINPYTLKPVYTPNTYDLKKEQNTLFFWYKQDNTAIIKQILTKTNHRDKLTKLGIVNRRNY